MLKATIIQYPGEYNRHALARTILRLSLKGFKYIASDNTDDEPIVLTSRDVEFSPQVVQLLLDEYPYVEVDGTLIDTDDGSVDLYSVEVFL